MGGNLMFISRGEHQSFSGGVYISNAGFPDVVKVSESVETECCMSLST